MKNNNDIETLIDDLDDLGFVPRITISNLPDDTRVCVLVSESCMPGVDATERILFNDIAKDGEKDKRYISFRTLGTKIDRGSESKIEIRAISKLYQAMETYDVPVDPAKGIKMKVNMIRDSNYSYKVPF